MFLFLCHEIQIAGRKIGGCTLFWRKLEQCEIQIAGGKIVGILALWKIQITSFMIWPQLAVFISYESNCYTTSASNISHSVVLFFSSSVLILSWFGNYISFVVSLFSFLFISMVHFLCQIPILHPDCLLLYFIKVFYDLFLSEKYLNIIHTHKVVYLLLWFSRFLALFCIS